MRISKVKLLFIPHMFTVFNEIMKNFLVIHQLLIIARPNVNGFFNNFIPFRRYKKKEAIQIIQVTYSLVLITYTILLPIGSSVHIKFIVTGFFIKC